MFLRASVYARAAAGPVRLPGVDPGSTEFTEFRGTNQRADSLEQPERTIGAGDGGQDRAEAERGR